MIKKLHKRRRRRAERGERQQTGGQCERKKTATQPQSQKGKIDRLVEEKVRGHVAKQLENVQQYTGAGATEHEKTEDV